MTQFKVAASGESEAQFRQFLAQIVTQGAFRSARNGVVGATGLGVTQTGTASGSVSVDAGLAITQDTVLAGASPLINDAAVAVNVFGPNPMGAVPRNDIVCFDSATSSIRVLTGSPNASPTDPAVPATAVALARLRHAGSATTITTDKIDDLRVWSVMRGGVLPVRDQADRDSLFTRTGDVVYRADTDNLEVWNGASWDVFGPGVQPRVSSWTGTVNGTGYNTVTHGAGYTPSAIIAQPEFAYSVGVDNITSTTFRIRLLNNGVAATGATKVMFVCYP